MSFGTLEDLFGLCPKRRLKKKKKTGVSVNKLLKEFGKNEEAKEERRKKRSRGAAESSPSSSMMRYVERVYTSSSLVGSTAGGLTKEEKNPSN